MTMNKIVRNLLLLAAILIIVGCVMAGAGFASGGMKSVSVTQNGLVVAGANGDTTVEVNESYSKITDVVIDVDLAELKLVEGSSFSLKGRYNPEVQDLSITEKAGVLTISRKPLINWFGFNFGFKYPLSNDLTLTYPKGTKFKSITITNNLGGLDVRNLEAKSLEVNLDAGSFDGSSILVDSLSMRLNLGGCTIKELTVAERAEFRLDAGSLDLERSSVNNLSVFNNLGGFDYSGALTGNVRIDLDVGSLKMSLENKADELSYTIDTDLGSIQVNGRKEGSPAHTTASSPTCTLDITTAMGGVTLNTR